MTKLWHVVVKYRLAGKSLSWSSDIEAKTKSAVKEAARVALQKPGFGFDSIDNIRVFFVREIR